MAVGIKLGVMESSPSPLPRGVVIAATPLGNIADASSRLIQGLREADVIAAEDTRRTRNLASALGIEPRGRFVSNFDHNEAARVKQLLETAQSGTVLVVTDAGMPSVSDPGFVLVDAALTAGVPVTCFPGPSAVPTALALSGLAVGRFIFDGFAPRKSGARTAWLKSLVAESRAVCFFESPHRLAETLRDAAEVLGGERRAAVCRELTKTFEEVRRGSLSELADWAAEGVRGEISVVIEGVRQAPVADVADVVEDALSRVAAGERVKQVAAELAAEHGLSKKELYDAIVAEKDH